MERIQPPPNYYGAPYPNTEPSPYPPQMNPYSQEGYPLPSNNQRAGDVAQPIEEFYESFNKLVSSNLGRQVNVHCSFTDSTAWHDK